jgi:hypothetical protein
MSSLAVGSPDPGFGLSPRRLTLVDLLEWRAQSQAERVAYTFLGESETERISLTGAELQRKAQLIGQRLVSLDAAGKTVLLLYPSDLEYVAAFFVKGPLPRKIHAYIRAKDSGSRNETITFDITLLDEEGVERVVIDSFSQKRVNDATGTIKLLAGTGARKDSAPETTAQNGTTAEGAETIYQRSLSEGIAPEEGVEAFRPILAHGRLPQVRSWQRLSIFRRQQNSQPQKPQILRPTAARFRMFRSRALANRSWKRSRCCWKKLTSLTRRSNEKRSRSLPSHVRSA